ncbi:hypothetical protein [Acaryochloris sp. CCMEE 5410]|uniref:hypothetical protein n=1 Tax=Acaryochloris sp. CCMEE 5410 TaxID=310037 RepID=UPI0002484D85|nr:hypothetical protein [Acaryochloris sp. CCMEE 5410]KAI9129151.1 hypothetical protein ON05_036225 [Acaryochloris sp. CCMEE 5410]
MNKTTKITNLIIFSLIIGIIPGIIDLYILKRFTPQSAVAIPNTAGSLRPPKLVASDLPPGFREVPTPISSLIRGAISSTISDHFGSNEIQIRDLVTYMNLNQWTLIIGFVTPLNNENAVQMFDLGLEQPSALEKFVTGIKKSNYYLGSVNIVEQRVAPSLSQKIGQVSTGMAVIAKARNVSLFSEMVAFRRNNLGAMLIVGRLNDNIPSMTTSKLAQKFDSQLLNFQSYSHPSNQQ